MERSLEGWVVKDWTIRPKLVAVLNFGNFRASPGKLPALRAVATGIITRDGIESDDIAPLVRALEAALR